MAFRNLGKYSRYCLGKTEVLCERTYYHRYQRYHNHTTQR